MIGSILIYLIWLVNDLYATWAKERIKKQTGDLNQNLTYMTISLELI